MAEQEFEVALDIDIEYEVGSPPTGNFDPYLTSQPGFVHHETLYLTEEGPSEGVITTATTALYPPFTSTLRRHIFGMASYGTPNTIAIAWNGTTFMVGVLWITTDPSYTAAGQVVTSAGEGAWFACEGELVADFHILRPGSSEAFSI